MCHCLLRYFYLVKLINLLVFLLSVTLILFILRRLFYKILFVKKIIFMEKNYLYMFDSHYFFLGVYAILLKCFYIKKLLYFILITKFPMFLVNRCSATIKFQYKNSSQNNDYITTLYIFFISKS